MDNNYEKELAYAATIREAWGAHAVADMIQDLVRRLVAAERVVEAARKHISALYAYPSTKDGWVVFNRAVYDEEVALAAYDKAKEEGP
jgi:hypothetical protein